MKKIIPLLFLISLSLPVVAQYRITFDNSNLELPEPPAPEQPEEQFVLSFDGADDYVDIPENMLGGESSLTIEFWFYHEGQLSDDNNHIFRDRGRDINVRVDSPHETNDIGITLGGIGEIDAGSVNSNAWHHLAVTYNGANIRLYLDAVEISSVSGSGTIGTENGGASIGRNPGFSQTFGGRLSDVRVWNTARTQSEIDNNMKEELTGNEVGLKAYYKLDSGSGTTAVDSAGSNDGTINGATWVEK